MGQQGFAEHAQTGQTCTFPMYPLSQATTISCVPYAFESRGHFIKLKKKRCRSPRMSCPTRQYPLILSRTGCFTYSKGLAPGPYKSSGHRPVSSWRSFGLRTSQPGGGVMVRQKTSSPVEKTTATCARKTTKKYLDPCHAFLEFMLSIDC